MTEMIDPKLPNETITVDDALCLRQLQLGDAERIFELVDTNREHLSKWLPWVNDTKSPKDSKNFIATMLEQRQKGLEYGYALVLDGSVVGHMSLMHLNDDQDPEIGYWIAESASGKGVTTRAAEALTKFGFDVLGLPKIVIKADQENLPSNRVAEKLGYTIERTEPSHYTPGTANVWAKDAHS